MRHPILHISMAMLVFISASGLLLNEHYCQGEWKGASLFVEGESCHDKEYAAVKCPLHGDTPMPEKDCCDDKTHFLKLEQQQSFTFQVLNEMPLPASFPSFSPLALHMEEPLRHLHFHNHKPPLIPPHPQADLQVFRC